MSYSVTCECSKVHPVSTGDAGSVLACTCGRTVEVPSLSKLRQQAGEFTAAPEMILESMLRDGELPQEDDCVVCHSRTDHVQLYQVVCEHAEAKKEVRGCGYLAYMIAFGWIGLIMATMANEQASERVQGRNVHYRLPLRICPVCDVKRSAAELKKLLCRVPVYEHLLKKYPHAQVSAV
jgi:hypothetical protein